MDAVNLKALYDAKGLAAVNAAIGTLDDHAQIVLLEDLEARGFGIKWHFADGDRDAGAVVAVPSDL